MLYDHNIECDFLFPDVSQEELAAYRLVIVPVLYAASEDLLGKLREYTRKNEELKEDIPETEPETGVAECVMIRSTFFELEDEERLIISMHRFAGYTSREIAEILHMNENTVRSKESRGLKKMAGKLDNMKI